MAALGPQIWEPTQSELRQSEEASRSPGGFPYSVTGLFLIAGQRGRGNDGQRQEVAELLCTRRCYFGSYPSHSLFL
jgi:hypothetical protein